jgi:hypothetical protein
MSNLFDLSTFFSQNMLWAKEWGREKTRELDRIQTVLLNWNLEEKRTDRTWTRMLLHHNNLITLVYKDNYNMIQWTNKKKNHRYYNDKWEH